MISLTRYIILIIICIVFANGVPAQTYITRVSLDSNKMYPSNITITDTALKTYLKKLNYAIDHKDTTLLRSLMDTNIKCNFGGFVGWQGFRELWHPENKNTVVWLLLKKLLSIGGAFTEGRYQLVYPYVFALPDHYDPFSTLVITGKDVDLLEMPDVHSKVVAKLSYDIVQNEDVGHEESPEASQLNPFGSAKWCHIRTADNHTGYVYWDKIWSPVDYRLFIEYSYGKWTMQYFVGGD